MKKISRRTFNATLGLGIGAFVSIPKACANKANNNDKLGSTLLFGRYRNGYA